MSLLQAIILGVVQGLTEFLPVSSSGHLVLGESLLKIKLTDISFEVFLHFGTLLAVTVYFRRKIWVMLKAVWLRVKIPYMRKESDQDWRLFWLIIIGSIPAGILGVLFKDIIEKSFTSVIFVSCMLLVTGLILFLTRFFHPVKEKLNFWDTLIVGCAQAIAILPGVSRSGSTISAGIFRRVEPGKAAEFSFLLSLPAVLGASLLKLKDVLSQGDASLDLKTYLIGALVAFGVGYLSIRFLLQIIKKGKFQYFSYYCFAVGLLFLIFKL